LLKNGQGECSAITKGRELKKKKNISVLSKQETRKIKINKFKWK
jgi:hypothetical protein